jgi:hypothetical protein
VRNENSPQRKKEHGWGRKDGRYRRGGVVCDSLVHGGPVGAREVVVELGCMVAGIQAVAAAELSLASAAVAGTSEEAVRGHRRALNPQLDNFRDHLRGLVPDHFADEDRQHGRARRPAPERKPE